MADPVFIIPNGSDNPVSELVLLPGSTGIGTGGLELLLPVVLLASIIPALLQIPGTSSPPVTTVTPAQSPCPVCVIPIPCTTPAPCIPVPTCPTGFMKLSNGGTEIPDKCYAFITTTIKFIEAIQQCGIKGATLANPMTVDEGLALKAYLQNNAPDEEFYLGYTDMGNTNDVMLALVGGEMSPIPGLNINAAFQLDNNEDDCTTILVTDAGTVVGDTPFCRTPNGAVCEINLKNQKCICP